MAANRWAASLGATRCMPVLDTRATAASHGDGWRSTVRPAPMVLDLAHEQCNSRDARVSAT